MTRRAPPPPLRTEDGNGQSKREKTKEKERKNRREHSWLCPERRTKRKTTEDTGAGVAVALSPQSADGRLKLASTRHSPRLAPCPLRVSAAASPRHQRLAAVCLPHRCPFCSPAHRRIGSGCCVHALTACRPSSIRIHVQRTTLQHALLLFTSLSTSLLTSLA